MRYFILLLSLFITLSIANEAYSATCAATSRTNYSTGQVLTSSALNSDLNQLVSKVNSLDGGCVTDGTLEATSLNSSDFSVVLNGIQQGCVLSYVDANTVQVGKCILSLNGAFVKTTSTNNVTWGCSGCSAEATDTLYYVYAKTGSAGTTLNLLISTTAPGSDGYDGSLNKVIGSFYNDAASAVGSFSVNTWSTIGFSKPNGVNTTPGATGATENFSFTFGASTSTPCTTGTCAFLDQVGTVVNSVQWLSTGNYSAEFSKRYSKVKCVAAGTGSGGPAIFDEIHTAGSTTMILSFVSSGTTGTDVLATVLCQAN